MRFRVLLFAGVLLSLGLTACEDPSNVGIGLVGGEGGEPVLIDVKAAVFEPTPLVDPSTDTARVLAGTAADPLLGDLRAVGYMDLSALQQTDGFKNNPVSSAVLFLEPGYVYGDTTSTLQFQLRSIPSAWTGAGASPDTTLPVGDVITAFSFSPTDTLVRVPLPAEWVMEQDTLLRGTTFSTNFHGFQIEPVSGNAVVGFNRSRSFLRAYTSADSASFPTTRTLSSVTRTGTLNVPPDRLVIQDGTGPTVQLAFDFTQEGLPQSGLNRALLRIHVDTLLDKTGTTFVRPRLDRLDLYAVTKDGEAYPIERAPLDSLGTFTFLTPTLRAELQDVLLGKIQVERFELRVPRGQNSLNPIFLYNDGSDERAPKVLLTVTRPEK